MIHIPIPAPAPTMPKATPFLFLKYGPTQRYAFELTKGYVKPGEEN